MQYRGLRILFALFLSAYLPVELGAVPADVVLQQFRIAPEDPSFSYDTRYVPGVESKEAYLSKELEKEVIVETIESGAQAEKSGKGLKLNLPNLPQAIVIGVIVVLFALYRMRIKNAAHRRR